MNFNKLLLNGAELINDPGIKNSYNSFLSDILLPTIDLSQNLSSKSYNSFYDFKSRRDLSQIKDYNNFLHIYNYEDFIDNYHILIYKILENEINLEAINILLKNNTYLIT